MKRITQKDLQDAVDRLNKLTDSPLVAWSRVDGKTTSHIGCYVLNSAYGGHSLQRIMNEGGGITTIICGYHSKRELCQLIHTYISGIFDGRESKQAKGGAK